MMSGDDTHKLDLGREVMVSFSSRAAMMVFGFAGVVLFARVLGPAGIGAYYLVLAGGRTISQLSNGIGDAVKKRVSETETDPGDFFAVGLLAHVGIAGTVAALGWFTSPMIDQLVEVPNLVISITIIVFSLGLFQISNALYAGIGNPGYAAWADTVRSVLTLLLQVTFVLLDWGAFGLVVAFSAASFISGIGVWIASGVVPRFPSGAVVKSTMEFGKWSVPSTLVGDLYGRMDIILIGILAGNTAVGYYETALRLVQPGAFFATSISGPLHVKASGLSSRSLDVVPDMKNSLSYAGLLAVPILFGAAVMPIEIMQTVFGSEFTHAWPALVGLAVFQVLSGYAKPFEAIVSGIDQVRYTFVISAFVLVVHVPMAVLLGVRYGMMGVVTATVVAEVIRLTVYQYLIRDLFEQFVLPHPVGEQLIAGAIMAVAVYGVLESGIAIRSWSWLLFVIGFGAGVYFVALTLLSSHFRETIENVVPIPAPYSR